MLPPCGAILGCWILAGALLAPSALLASLHGAETSIVAHPQDLWWPLKHMDGLYPVPPALLSDHARQLAVALALATAAALALRARRTRTPLGLQRCLALLALGFALRCLLEPSAQIYYQLPLVLALAAWELHARRSVAIALTAMILLRLDFGRLGQDAPAIPYALYLALLLPICALLVADLLRTPGVRRTARTTGERCRHSPGACSSQRDDDRRNVWYRRAPWRTA